MHSPLLSEDDWQQVDAFHRLYFGRVGSWMGLPILKNPMDLHIYQELLWRLRPDTVIECGTAWGASALYLAQIMDLLGNGRVMTIDKITDVKRLYFWAFGEDAVVSNAERPVHPRITYIHGSSTDPEIVRLVRQQVHGTTMVILDSAHDSRHVFNECELYAPLVTEGSYLCVEDVNIHGHPVVLPDDGPGPYEAAIDFLLRHDEFKWDVSWTDRYLFSYNAYLCRVPRSARNPR